MIIHWDIHPELKEIDIEAIVQRAMAFCPWAKPRIISDNGPQFIAKDSKSFVRLSDIAHVLTSPCYPQSNGKLKRHHRSSKHECARPKTPLNLEDAKRLHSAIG
jgi:transposase InsO family protein